MLPKHIINDISTFLYNFFQINTLDFPKRKLCFCHLTLVMMGGGLKVPHPPIFICENNRKSNKIMHCVEKKKSLSGSFEDKAIFHVILAIDR